MAIDYVKLKLALESTERDLVSGNQIQNDPLSRVLRFKNPQDQEVVALISAVFAYGNVKHILKTIDDILALLGPSPSEKIKATTGSEWKSLIPRKFRYRFNTADDLGLLFTWLGHALRHSGTLEDYFMACRKPTMTSWLEEFIERLTTLPSAPYKKPKSKGALFFFPRPSQKSGCKRLMLFLRWMAGTGPAAVNIWKNVNPELLVIPVDTHVLRISKNLGLTKRKDASMKTALEITAELKKIAPLDPTRYDFALCHLGISKACPSRFKIEICKSCGINSLCRNYA